MRKIIHVVDDDASVRAATSFLLTSRGYSTLFYDSGAELLRRADLDEGCILLDLQMADMSGFEVLETLQERQCSAPVIILTGHGDVATAVLALKLGAVDFIQKPFEDGVLFAAIERAFAGDGHDGRRKEAKRAALEQLERLSGREKQVLRGLLGGMTNKEMARYLDLSPRTIEMHRSTMMADLGVDAAADAIRIAIAAELSPLDKARPETAAELTAATPPAPHPRPTPLLPHAAPAPRLEPCEASSDRALLRDRGLQIVVLDKDAEREIAITAIIGANGELQVTVSDHGFGLSDETIGQLFLPFGSPRNQGAGIGLTVSRNPVEAHGTRTGVEAKGGGASIGFTLEPREPDPVLRARAA